MLKREERRVEKLYPLQGIALSYKAYIAYPTNSNRML